MPTMPDILGRQLWDAQQGLEDAGVLVLASLGYFDTYPISVTWVANPYLLGQPITADSTLVTVDSGYITADQVVWTGRPGDVIAQSIAAGSAVAVNVPVLLTVIQYPIGVSYP